jgi:hypothetical protein
MRGLQPLTGLDLVVLLLAVAAVLRMLTDKLRVPYAALLVVGGLLPALVPGLPRAELPPDTLFLVFVPPLLYSGSRRFPLRDFRRQAGPIVRLAVLRVVVSTVAVAVVAHMMDPAFTWPAVFTLGAVVSPPDPVAVLSIMRSVRAPQPIETILEGEGLFNDATALVIYRVAVGAAVTGVFSAPRATAQFLVGGAGGIGIGLLSREPLPPWQWVTFIGWAGIRGGDALVIALAVPLATAAGTPFPARDQILFITFGVIFATLVLQGPTLAPLVRLLALRGDGHQDDEEAHARLVATEAALDRLANPAIARSPYPEVVRYLQQRYRQRARRWAARESRQLHGRSHDCLPDHSVGAPSHEAGALDERRIVEYRRLRSESIDAERRAVIALRDQSIIGDDVMARIQRDLDLEAMLLDTREPVQESPTEVPSSLDGRNTRSRLVGGASEHLPT